MTTKSCCRNVMFQIRSPTLIECFLKKINNCLSSMRRDRTRCMRGTGKSSLIKFSFFIRIIRSIISLIETIIQFRQLHISIGFVWKFDEKKTKTQWQNSSSIAFSYLRLHSMMGRTHLYLDHLIHHNTMLDQTRKLSARLRLGTVEKCYVDSLFVFLYRIKIWKQQVWWNEEKKDIY